MPIRQKRAAIALAATVVAAACGTLAGYLLGRALVLRHAENKLDEYAIRIRTEAETSATKSRALLATLNGSPYPYCSDEEIAWIRKLIFQSEYLKDGGHMRDGRIDCSATLGRQSRIGPQFKPEFLKQDGTRLYLEGIGCTGELAKPETVKCKGTGAYENPRALPTTAFEGINTGSAVVIGTPCEGHGAVLETGTGDWTETDTIQGSQSTNDNFNESGAPIGTDGPVLTLVPGSVSGTARIVVHNLKTGAYEGYIVTATCSR